MKKEEQVICGDCGQVMEYGYGGWKCQCPPPDDNDFWEDDYNPDLDDQT